VDINRFIDQNPLVVTPDTVCLDAIALMNQRQQNGLLDCILVVTAESLRGIITKTDVIRLLAQGVDLAITRVAEVMSQPVITIERSLVSNLESICLFVQKHSFSYIPVMGAKKDLYGVIAVKNLLQFLAEDIQKHQEAEQALKESETRWQLALRGANDGIWDWNVKTNEVFFSKRWKEMLGFTEAEIRNTLEEWSKRVHPDDLAWVTQIIEDHFAKKTPFYTSEHRVLCKDGTYKWILDRGQALWDEAGNVVRMAGSHTDISDRKIAEMQLKQERDFSKALIETVGALIAVLDRQGAIVSFNHTCEQITGYSFAQIKGQQIWEWLIPPEEKATVKAVFEKLLTGQISHQYENSWIAKDGSRHLISWSNTVLLDAQGIVEFVIATGIDVTEQHRVWNQLEHQYRQTKLLTELTRKIRMSIELEEILQTAVTEIQHLLSCDRVLLVEIYPHQIAVPISESILPDIPSMLGYQLRDPLLVGEDLTKYRQGEFLAIDSIAHAEIDSNIKDLLAQFHIKAKLVVPILSQNELQGLLVAHQCSSARKWQDIEIQLLTQLADQIGVALSQAQLLNHLEEMVAERTTELMTTNQLLQAEIKERQQTEAALRENQQKLTGILDNADEAIISLNEQQKIQLFNQGAENIFGYKAQEVLHQPLDILLPEAFRQIHRQHVDQFNQSSIMSRDMSDRKSQIFGLRKNGEEFPAEASIAKLQTRKGILFTVMLKDITERQQAEESLQRSEEQLKLITDALPVLIAYIDYQQRYIYNNLTYETWFSKPRPSLLGMHIQELFGTDNYQKMLPYIETVLSGQNVSFEMQLSNSQGNFYWMNATYIADFNGEGQVKGFFSMINNITERKEIERMKSEFVSIASHEMRTPLTSIYGAVRLLCSGRLGALSPKGQKMADIALQNSDRLINLLNDLLDLERLELGKDNIERQHCNSVELITQAIETLNFLAQEQQITLESKAQSCNLWIDRDRILQTITNLLSNAIKFSATGSKVFIACCQQEQDILFTVEDHGRGIPQDKLETIFERFQQVDASDSRQKGGTGLGLTICRHIIEQHGGKIWVKSIYGKGSTFYFTLPQPSFA
jgi:PAS domain S-box-containing protein